jgi:hypothetical protein
MAKAAGKSSGDQKKKYFLYALGIGVVGGGVYFASKYFQDKASQDQPQIENNNNIYLTQGNSGSSASARNDNFPLKKGSKGQRVTQLQQAIAKKIGLDKMNFYGGIDGDFGSKTQQALITAGFPTVIDEAAFSKIISGTGTSAISRVASAGATKLQSGAESMSGIRIYKDLVTIAKTYVLDQAGNKIIVNKNTILGEEISKGNGMTLFKSIDNSINSVPTRDITYA